MDTGLEQYIFRIVRNEKVFIRQRLCTQKNQKNNNWLNLSDLPCRKNVSDVRITGVVIIMSEINLDFSQIRTYVPVCASTIFKF